MAELSKWQGKAAVSLFSKTRKVPWVTQIGFVGLHLQIVPHNFDRVSLWLDTFVLICCCFCFVCQILKTSHFVEIFFFFFLSWLLAVDVFVKSRILKVSARMILVPLGVVFQEGMFCFFKGTLNLVFLALRCKLFFCFFFFFGNVGYVKQKIWRLFSELVI